MDRSRSRLNPISHLLRENTSRAKEIRRINTSDKSIPDWVNPVLQGAWVNAGGGEDEPGFWRNSAGIVYCKGVIKSGVIGTIAFNLPAGFRPGDKKRLPIISLGAFGYVTIESNGDVTISAGNNAQIDLAGVCFRGEV